MIGCGRDKWGDVRLDVTGKDRALANDNIHVPLFQMTNVGGLSNSNLRFSIVAFYNGTL